MSDIPVGLCQCGCGQPTLINLKTVRAKGWVKGEPKRFLHGHHTALRKLSAHPRWKGGRQKAGGGYVRAMAPEHPRAYKGTVLEHILIVERALGHLLPMSAEVHHVDGQRDHNEPHNLVACEDRSYHQLLHRRMRALEACGDPNASPCGLCGSYERQDEMYVHVNKQGYPVARHRSCRNAYMRRLNATKRREATC